jgi:3-oxoacyl-[acyl-carrier protein] reductase
MNEIALVSGANRGIGRAIAESLAAAGHRVVLLGRNAAALAAQEAAMQKAGLAALAAPCDVSRPAEIEAALQTVTERWGAPSILVNNAGIGGPFSRVDEVTPAEWELLFRTNIEGPFHLCRLLLPAMKARGFGRIINISSVFGLFGGAHSSTYAATKHALIGHTRSIAAEWGRYGITCNAVCPGYTVTDMMQNASEAQLQPLLQRIPAQRFGRPEEIAGLVSYLAGPQSGYMNGAVLVMDGGLSAHLAGGVPAF